MAFNNSFTAVTGATYTAAQYNTHTRDNFTAIWVYTTAGDIAYATSPTTLARREIGSAYTFLKSDGSVPVWGKLDFCSVSHNTTQNVSSGSLTVLSFNTDLSDDPGWHNPSANNSRITVNAAGFYGLSVFFGYSTSGGSGTYRDVVEFRRSGTEVAIDRRYQEVEAYSKYFSVTAQFIYADAGMYFEVFLEQNSGLLATVEASPRFAVWRIT